jgi:hypothetical protein
MPSKKLIMVLMLAGSMIGGYAPSLFGAGMFSFTSLFCSAAGALAGIWLAFRMSR